jgi:hypothetical protein
MDVIAIREELADMLRDATSLPVYELPTGQVTAPAILMGAPSGEYDTSMGGTAQLSWPLVVIVSRSHPDSLSRLGAILGHSDDQSIPNALDANPPAAASWWRATGWETWTEIEFGTTSYWAATVNTEIGV